MKPHERASFPPNKKIGALFASYYGRLGVSRANLLEIPQKGRVSVRDHSSKSRTARDLPSLEELLPCLRNCAMSWVHIGNRHRESQESREAVSWGSSRISESRLKPKLGRAVAQRLQISSGFRFEFQST